MGCLQLSYYEDLTGFTEVSRLKICYVNPKLRAENNTSFLGVVLEGVKGGGNGSEYQYKQGNSYDLNVRYKEPVSVGIGHGGASYSSVTISNGKEIIKSSGMGGNYGFGASLFHQSKSNTIHFHQTLSGNNILDVFGSTTQITTKTGGGFIIFDLVRGFDKNGNLLWSSQLRGSAFGGEIGGGQGKASFDWVK